MKGSATIIFFCALLQLGSSAEVTDHPNWRLLNDNRCGNSNAVRIIGGRDARLGQFPWFARIGYAYANNPQKTVFDCGGSLLNNYYVITAGHCLRTNTQVVGVRLGEYNLMTNPDCENGYCAPPVQDIAVGSIMVPNGFDYPSLKHDIGLIRLQNPAQFTDFVLPICIMPVNSANIRNFVGTYAEVTGFGFTDSYRRSSEPILKTNTEPIVSLSRCAASFTNDIGPSQLCVGGVPGQDTCFGDSGGPLMQVENYNGRPRYFLIGVVSFGALYCGANQTPSVCTRIDYFLSWILDNIY